MDKVFIELQKGQKIFFTSDPHYGHRNILNFCNRPFKDTKEMEKALIENWNSVVGDNDIAFILGDVMWFEGRNDCKKVLEQYVEDSPERLSTYISPINVVILLLAFLSLVRSFFLNFISSVLP